MIYRGKVKKRGLKHLLLFYESNTKAEIVVMSIYYRGIQQ